MRAPNVAPLIVVWLINMKRIVIIGGGISGLAAAHRVLELTTKLRLPVQLTLLEASNKLGGTVQTTSRDGFLIERGPDSFISEKPECLDLVKRLGIEFRLIETNSAHRRSFIVKGSRLIPMPAGFNLLAPSQIWPFLTSDILSFAGKARLALDLLLPRRAINGNTDESLADFVRRRLGHEALERIAQPMIAGIYTADPETLSLKATMPRFLEMEQQSRSLMLALKKKGSEAASETQGARYGLFLSFDSGMQVLTDELARHISKSNKNPHESSIRLNTVAESLAMDASSDYPKWKIQIGNEILTADAVCLALPAFVCARLLRSIDESLASELASIPYASTATINLGYKREDIRRPLDGFGFVVPFVEKRTVMACTFSSVKFADRAPDGRALLRAFVGGALQGELLSLSDEEMIQRVRDDLRDLLGVKATPLFSEVSRWENSMPQYLLGHLDRVAKINSRLNNLPGLELAGNAYSGVGIPDCIRSGESAANRLIDSLDLTE